MHRIRRLLNQPEQPRAAAALLLSMGFLLGLFCLVRRGPAANLKPTREFSHARKRTPYTKWLNEDVVYIITPQERAAFERLRNRRGTRSFH